MLKLKLQYFGHLNQRANSLALWKGLCSWERLEGRRRRGQQRMRYEFEQAPGDGDGQGSLACCSPWSHNELDMTEQLNNNQFQ